MSDPAKSQRACVPEASRPRLAKCIDPRAEASSAPFHPEESRRAASEERAAGCYRAAVKAMGREWSVRRAAHDIERSVRMHLDYQSGGRSIPLDVTMLVPEQPAQVAFLIEYARGMTRGGRAELRARLDELSDEDEQPARVA